MHRISSHAKPPETERSRFHIALNILGLSIGMSMCLAIAVFLANEFSYDRYHEHAKEGRLYRITFRLVESRGTNMRGGLTPPPMAQAVKQELPDMVEVIARCRRKDTDVHYGSPIVQSPMLAESEPRFYWVDPSFFGAFSVPFRAGDPKTALVKPGTIVITVSVARKYFGTADPIGKTLKVDGDLYVVTGVTDDPPANTHLHADLMASMESVEDSRDTYWVKNNYFTYVVLKPGASVDEFNAGLKRIVAKYFDADLRKRVNYSLDDMAKNGNWLWFYLHPVPDIHLAQHDFETEPSGNGERCLLLLWAAVGILCLAFLNVASLLRGKPLLLPSIKTSVSSALLALAIALAVCPVLLLYGDQMRNDDHRLSLFDPWWIVPASVPLTVALAIAAASLRVGLDRIKRIQVYRVYNSWAVLQFAVSAATIVGALAVARQVHYITTKELGLSLDNVVVLKETDGLREKMQPFKEALRTNASIVAVSDSATLPGRQFRGKSHSLALDSAAGDLLTLWQITTDTSFADTFQVQLVEGRFFSADSPNDHHSAVINEAASRMLDVKIGTTMYEHNPGEPYVFKVIGIVRDFHYESMRHFIRPTSIKLVHYQPGRVGRFVSVRVRDGELDAAMAHIATVWKKFLPERRLEYMFAAQDYDRVVAPDRVLSRVVSCFAAVSLFFAAWALVGAVSRRPLSVSRHWATRRVAIQVALANVIGIPVGYVVAENWISGFYYRIGFSPWIFVATVLATTCVAIGISVWAHPREASAESVDTKADESLAGATL